MQVKYILKIVDLYFYNLRLQDPCVLFVQKRETREKEGSIGDNDF